MTQTGHCLCGETTYAFDGEIVWQGHCHCESCRRNCAAPVTTFFGVPRGGFRWTGRAPGSYESTPNNHRLFCTNCGTPMAYDGGWDKKNMHLYVTSLDDQTLIAPTIHFHHDEAVPYLILGDDLERRIG